MFSKKEIIIFFAGFEASHTLTHIFMRFLGMLPVHIAHIVWTEQLNNWSIIINLIITAALIWWARNLKR